MKTFQPSAINRTEYWLVETAMTVRGPDLIRLRAPELPGLIEPTVELPSLGERRPVRAPGLRRRRRWLSVLLLIEASLIVALVYVIALMALARAIR